MGEGHHFISLFYHTAGVIKQKQAIYSDKTKISRSIVYFLRRQLPPSVSGSILVSNPTLKEAFRVSPVLLKAYHVPSATEAHPNSSLYVRAQRKADWQQRSCTACLQTTSPVSFLVPCVPRL